MLFSKMPARAGKLTQQVEHGIPLAESLSSVHSTHVGWLTPPGTAVPGTSGLRGYLCSHTPTQVIPMHNLKRKKKTRLFKRMVYDSKLLALEIRY